MAPVSDLKGKRFSRLVVQARAGRTSHGNVTWLCVCDCGNVSEVAGQKLKSGHTRSCGCLVKETVAGLGLASKLTHGHSSNRRHTRAYSVWHGMMSRCHNANHGAYEYYGGRGISVCQRWHRFEDFYADMGDPPDDRSIDRINNEGNYEPGNCRWATVAEQLANRRPRRFHKKAA
jgi:hypothetical protein